MGHGLATSARSAVVALSLMVVAACASHDPSPAIVLPLHTVPQAEDTEGFACAGVGLAAILHGNPADPEVVWLGRYPGMFAGGPERLLTVWPAGYRAVFSPGMTVIDAMGSPRLQEGDFIDGACVTGGERLLIVPAEDGFALECGSMEVNDCTGGRVSQAARKAGEAANGRKVTLIRFLNSTGKFVVVYEDGSTSEGFTSSL